MHVEGSKHAQRMCKFFKGYLYFTAGKKTRSVVTSYLIKTIFVVASCLVKTFGLIKYDSA